MIIHKVLIFLFIARGYKLKMLYHLYTSTQKHVVIWSLSPQSMTCIY